MAMSLDINRTEKLPENRLEKVNVTNNLLVVIFEGFAYPWIVFHAEQTKNSLEECIEVEVVAIDSPG